MTKTKLRTLAIALALVTGAGGLAHAAQNDAPVAPATQAAPAKSGPDGHPGWHGRDGHHRGGPQAHRGHHDASPFKMTARLKAKLNLTPEQETRFNAADAQRREVGKAMWEQRSASRKAMAAKLSTGPADFRAMSAQRDADRAALKPKLDAARDAWLVAYDSLNVNQKQIVTDAFKHSLARGDHRGGPRGDHRGDHHRGGDMKRPAAPAAAPASPAAMP